MIKRSSHGEARHGDAGRPTSEAARDRAEAISYALSSLDDDDIDESFGASRDELEGTRDDLREALAGLRERDLEPEPVG